MTLSQKQKHCTVSKMTDAALNKIKNMGIMKAIPKYIQNHNSDPALYANLLKLSLITMNDKLEFYRYINENKFKQITDLPVG